MKAHEYEKILLDEIEQIRNTTHEIVIFGTKAYSIMMKCAAEYLGKKISCFCDNNEKKQGTFLENTIILSPLEVKQRYPEAEIFLCFLTRENEDIVTCQLKNIGFEQIHKKDALIYIYQTEILKRPVDSMSLVETMYKLGEEDAVNFVGVATFITEKCNLRCKDCGYFIPYYKKPLHFDKEEIKRELKLFAESVDGVAVMSILGGETLLYNAEDLIEICQFAYSLPQFLFVRIITNGTIVPNRKVLEQLKISVTHINISDYGTLSRHLQELEKVLGEHGIVYDRAEQGTIWYPVEPPKKRNRTDNENQALFEQCCVEKDILHRGGLHLCEYSAVTVLQGKLPITDPGYVNLFDESLDCAMRREKIKKYLKNKSFIHACDYCGFDFQGSAPRAQQTKEVLEW